MQPSDVFGFGKSPSYRPLPPILKSGDEWEGGAIVREIPSSVGLFLFGTIRDVMLWLLSAERASSDSLFCSSGVETRLRDLQAITAPPTLELHLGTLVRVAEGSVERQEVGGACIGVATWANAIHAPFTELAYTQAGAIALPDSLVYALETAKLARELSQYRRSETWFRTTIKRARSIKDRGTYVLGYLGLGNLYGRIGNGPAAKAIIELALRQSKRWRLGELAGRAHHDLIRVWTELGDLRQAYDHAGEAGRCYGDSSVQQVRLAADVATLWLRASSASSHAAVASIAPKSCWPSMPSCTVARA